MDALLLMVVAVSACHCSSCECKRFAKCVEICGWAQSCVGTVLIGRLPSELGQLSQLTVLWLYDNQLTGALLFPQHDAERDCDGDGDGDVVRCSVVMRILSSIEFYTQVTASMHR